MIQSPISECSNVLRFAFKEGVVKPSLQIYEDAPVSAMLWARTVHSAEAKTAYIRPQQDSQALRAQVQNFGKIEDLTYSEDNLVELARVYVPENNTGYLTNIEQYLADRLGEYYATQGSFLGVPFSETMDINGIRWYLRLSANDDTPLAPESWNGVGILNHEQLLPGEAYPDLPMIEGLWYPGSKGNAFCGIIPQGFCLRLFCWSPADANQIYEWVIAGRLSGYTQSSKCPEAQMNTRLLF